MNYGPWAMELATRLLIRGPGSNNLSIIFFRSLKLGAWALVLGAWVFQLDACSLHLLVGSRSSRPTLHGVGIFWV